MLLKILLIEDNPSDVRLFQEYLREVNSFSYELVHMDRLSNALEYLAVSQPDVILLDLGLPDSQGIETFEKFRTASIDIPTIILSGLDDSELALQAVQTGAQDYLSKMDVSGGLLARSIQYAIERKRTEKALQESKERLQTLAKQVVNAQENERRRISRELHDDAGQNLTAILINLELLSEQVPSEFEQFKDTIAETTSMVDVTMESLRLLAHDLRPPVLDTIGLDRTLREMCNGFGERTGLSIQYQGTDILDVPDIYQITFYRVAQEALTNILKHAWSKHSKG